MTDTRFSNEIQLIEQGRLLINSNKFSEAISVLLDAAYLLESTQCDVSKLLSGLCRYYCGFSYQHIENYERAIQCYSISINNSIHIGKAFLFRSQCYAELLQFQHADHDVNVALSVLPECPECYHMKAVILYKTARYEESIKWFQDSLHLEPDNFIYSSNYAALLSTCPVDSVRNGSLALDLALKSCRLNGYDDWKLVSVLAAAYAECGDFDNAIIYAEKAYSIAPESRQGERISRIELFRSHTPLRLSYPMDPGPEHLMCGGGLN